MGGGLDLQATIVHLLIALGLVLSQGFTLVGFVNRVSIADCTNKFWQMNAMLARGFRYEAKPSEKVLEWVVKLWTGMVAQALSQPSSTFCDLAGLWPFTFGAQVVVRYQLWPRNCLRAPGYS